MGSKSKKSIVIIGGGPSAMMLACTLDHSKYEVTIVEKGKAIGRKFLVAGKGGFNLTHSEDIKKMMQKYDGPKILLDALSHFSNEDFREWISNIGIETYIGSSKRVFPIKGIKPIEVLQAILKKLEQRGVTILTETSWLENFIDKGSVELIQKKKTISLKADILVFAMGGGSWKVTGSDGNWLNTFTDRGISTQPFRPSNCALNIDWTDSMKDHFGKPIKNIALGYGDQYIKGELLITEKGIEGSPAYALSYYVVNELIDKKNTELLVDLKPAFNLEKIQTILSNRNKKTSKILRDELALSSVAVALIKSHSTREEFSNPKHLAHRIKNLSITVIGTAEIDEAISTAGGIDASAINDDMQLTDLPNHYVIGEMVDWNGPTGGYLLQACFSMGKKLGDFLNDGFRA